MEGNKNIAIVNEDSLFDKVSELIEESRKRIVKAVNTAMVYTYYGVGRYIVEYEQGGKALLQAKLREWIEEYNEINGEED